jgi:signal peptidase I
MTLRKWMFVGAVCALLTGCERARWSSGDRVLVSKFAYDAGLQTPARHNVVVFKFPRMPIEKNTPKNYIKRLWGLPGEILAIFFGRVYHWTPQPGQAPPYDDSNVDPHRLWEHQYMHENEEPSRKLFEEGDFQILRKPPEVMLALRRIVHDNDYQAKDLVGKVPPRWDPAATVGWKGDQPHSFVHNGSGTEAGVDWLRYQHILRPHADGVVAGGLDPKSFKPRLITDVMGYNSYTIGRNKAEAMDSTPTHHWVGDLMLECQVEVLEPKGELFFELSKGINRFQARWDLTSGTCTLYKLTGVGAQPEKKEEIGTAPTRVKAPGSYQIRFANIDARLTVWVARELPFHEGLDYPQPEVRGPHDKDLPEDKLLERRGPTENDLQPASLGSKGAHVKVGHLRLWRDTYYTTAVPNRGADYAGGMPPEAWSDPSQWGPLKHQRYTTLYVQPGHYLVLGDNSPNSSDSRDWGTVPERLMLGRALVVYYPFQRAGAIR